MAAGVLCDWPGAGKHGKHACSIYIAASVPVYVTRHCLLLSISVLIWLSLSVCLSACGLALIHVSCQPVPARLKITPLSSR